MFFFFFFLDSKQVARSCLLEWTCKYKARPVGDCGTIIRSCLASALTKETDTHRVGGSGFLFGCWRVYTCWLHDLPTAKTPAGHWVRAGDANPTQPGVNTARAPRTDPDGTVPRPTGRGKRRCTTVWFCHPPPVLPALGPAGLWGPKRPEGPNECRCPVSKKEGISVCGPGLQLALKG